MSVPRHLHSIADALAHRIETLTILILVVLPLLVAPHFLLIIVHSTLLVPNNLLRLFASFLDLSLSPIFFKLKASQPVLQNGDLLVCLALLRPRIKHIKSLAHYAPWQGTRGNVGTLSWAS